MDEAAWQWLDKYAIYLYVSLQVKMYCVYMWRVGPSRGELCQTQATVSFRQPLVRGAVNDVHDVHTVCVNDFELDAFYEIDKSCVSTKGVDGETDKVLSGVTASIQQKAGSLGETQNAELSALTPIDASYEYPATWDNKY